jgi:acyl-CoA thioesterase-1
MAGIFLLSNNDPIRNTPPKNQTIVALGDSLISGVGSTEGNDLVSVLSREIDREIINLGVSGDTTEQGLARIDQVRRYDPGIVIILLGGNDFLRRVPIDETRQNLATIIETLQSDGAAILLLGVRGGLLTDSYDDMYQDLADTYETGYVDDVLGGLITNAEFMSDAIHPNDEGYEIISGRVMQKLRQML